MYKINKKCIRRFFMYKYLKIVNVVGREVLDSRGNPTVEAEVTVKVDGKAALNPGLVVPIKRFSAVV